MFYNTSFAHFARTTIAPNFCKFYHNFVINFTIFLTFFTYKFYNIVCDTFRDKIIVCFVNLYVYVHIYIYIHLIYLFLYFFIFYLSV